MPDYKKPPGHECPPPEVDPADQPKPPAGDPPKYGCENLPKTTPPVPEYPEKCKPDIKTCKCPDRPGSDPNCLEKLIAVQTNEITKADKAKTFKTDLEALLGKARTGNQAYTHEVYEKLVKQWADQDKEIAELIRKLVCAVPCWRCLIECHVCTLLYDLRDAELRLNGDGTWCNTVSDLQDLLYWHTRDRAAKERVFNRIKNVLAAWENPSKTIEKTLGDVRKLIDAANKALGTEATKVVYDVFLKLIPLHLAIAPPNPPGPQTKIDKKYTQFCDCDTGKPDDCCGPDVGELSLRERLIPYLPYLIDPNDYFKVICCLVERRYGPAKEMLSEADAEVVAAENEIKRLKTLIDDGLKNFDTNARAAIPLTVDCCDYEHEYEKKDEEPPSYKKY